MAYCELNAIKCQHQVADMSYPLHFKKRATADIKHVLTLGWHQAITATAGNNGAIGEDMQPQPVGEGYHQGV